MQEEAPRTAAQVLLIPIEKIKPNPNQPRRVFDQGELVNLAISVRMNGILQPLTIRKTGDGFELVSGERRLRAARLAGLAAVPCILVDANDLKSAVYALIENLQRQNLGYFEEAAAIERLMRQFGLSQEDAARRLGKAPSTVSNKLRLEQAQILPVLEKVIARRMNVAQTEKYIDELLLAKQRPRRSTKRLFSDVRIFLNTIQNAFDTMKSAGINADLQSSETGEYYLYEIRIPKKTVRKA